MASICGACVDGNTYPTATQLNYTLFHPVGVCALISPCNVPFMTATWKTTPCLAFGNTAVLKMIELSPLSAARLGELALEGTAGSRILVQQSIHRRSAERFAERFAERAKRITVGDPLNE